MMKLSEAIRLGATLAPQGFGKYLDEATQEQGNALEEAPQEELAHV